MCKSAIGKRHYGKQSNDSVLNAWLRLYMCVRLSVKQHKYYNTWQISSHSPNLLTESTNTHIMPWNVKSKWAYFICQFVLGFMLSYVSRSSVWGKRKREPQSFVSSQNNCTSCESSIRTVNELLICIGRSFSYLWEGKQKISIEDHLSAWVCSQNYCSENRSLPLLIYFDGHEALVFVLFLLLRFLWLKCFLLSRLMKNVFTKFCVSTLKKANTSLTSLERQRDKISRKTDRYIHRKFIALRFFESNKMY